MTMLEIGRSLDPSTTLEAQSRRNYRRHRGHVCRACRRDPYPRGYCPSQGLCWWCVFPRPASSESEGD